MVCSALRFVHTVMEGFEIVLHFGDVTAES